MSILWIIFNHSMRTEIHIVVKLCCCHEFNRLGAFVDGVICRFSLTCLNWKAKCILNIFGSFHLDTGNCLNTSLKWLYLFFSFYWHNSSVLCPVFPIKLLFRSDLEMSTNQIQSGLEKGFWSAWTQTKAAVKCEWLRVFQDFSELPLYFTNKDLY